MSLVVPVEATSDFPIQNLPFGVISTQQEPQPRPASAIGDYAIDLQSVAQAELFNGKHLNLQTASAVFVGASSLNAFMALGRVAWRECRSILTQLLSSDSSVLRTNIELRNKVLIPLRHVRMHIPATIGDYTDFYASKEHATNVGTMFRGKENALMPNWVHIPIGYHGRASSVVVSGTPIKRPHGMVLNPATKTPEFAASRKMDFELEVAAFVGVGNALGDRVSCSDAEERIFGIVLMNDWSARDIQQFEYQPLGPFLGKNFGTTISPWIVSLDALQSCRVPTPMQDPTPVKYLLDPTSTTDAFDVALQVHLRPSDASQPSLISESNLKYLYWSFKQQLAHHTVNGCNMRTGDLFATGTISGPTPTSFGSLLELSHNGSKPIVLDSGATRGFIEDGDEIILRGFANVKDGEGRSVRIGFGDCSGVLVAAAESK